MNISNNDPMKEKLVKLHRQFGHPGADKLIQLLRSAKMSNKSVENEIRNISAVCEICIRLKKAPPRPVVSLPMASHFNETIAMDLKFYEDIYFLVIVDLATRYCSASVIRDKRSSTIVKNVMISWISRWGPSKRILTDNGKEFDSEEFRSMGDTFGITILTTAAEAPFSNGVCERLNSVIGRSVNKIMLESKCSVEEALAWSVSARNSLSNNSGFSPNQLVFGYNPCMPNVMGDKLPALENSSFEMIRRNMNAMHTARQAAIQVESSERIRRALRHNVRPTDTSLIKVGDKVYYKRNNNDQWHGPSILIGKDGKQMFVKHGGSYVRVHSCRLQKAPLENQDGIGSSEKAPITEVRRICDTIPEDDESNEESGDETEPNANGAPPLAETQRSAAEPIGESSQQYVDTTALKLKTGNRLEVTDTISGETYTGKIESRAGKATGKYKNCFNFRKDTDNSVTCVDFDKDVSNVKRIEDTEEILITCNSDSVMKAKKQELENWNRNGVYEEVEQIERPHRPISVRWVVTEKIREGQNIVKARLVARGFEENTSNIPKDSPTCSKESVRTAISIACAMGWNLNSLDVKSAYLQGNEVTREIYLKPPPEFNYGQFWKLKKTVYGLNDAGRAWYMKVKEVLLQLGGRMSHLEPALFSWRDNCGFHGIVCVYVDDFLWAGTSDFWRVIEEIKRTFKIGASEEKAFKYIGLNIQSYDHGVTVDQTNYIKSIAPMKLNPDRKKQRKSPLSEVEKEEFRKLIGQLNWASTQTRPDISYDVCELSVALKAATVENILQLNKVIVRIRSEEFKLWFPKLSSMRSAYLECYADASYANLPDEGSQGGFVIFLKNGERCPIAWQSKKLKRVVNSTLAAEAMSLLEGAGVATYIAELIAEMTGASRMKIHCFTDCKSLFDNLQTYHKVEDRRTRIDMACIRDMVEKQEIQVHWLDTENQIADALTKKGASTKMLRNSMTVGGH